MQTWKKWLDPDHAFSANGETMKKVIKTIYVVELFFTLVAVCIGLISYVIALILDFDTFNVSWPLLFVLPLVAWLAPFLIYWGLAFLYGFAELVSNSYQQAPCNEQKPESDSHIDFENIKAIRSDEEDETARASFNLDEFYVKQKRKKIKNMILAVLALTVFLIAIIAAINMGK